MWWASDFAWSVQDLFVSDEVKHPEELQKTCTSTLDSGNSFLLSFEAVDLFTIQVLCIQVFWFGELLWG